MAARCHYRLKSAVAAAGIALLAGCATPPPAPPPPPELAAPPTPEPIPRRPVPPDGASADTPIPPVGSDGVRQTVNVNLSSAQAVWNLRSGLNVAALNCLDPQDAPILAAYKMFLERHEKQLAETNRTLDSEFREMYGKDYRSIRDSYMTRVYNYFALPPTQDAFCITARQLSQRYLATPPEDLYLYAANALPQLDAGFLEFFAEFDDYRVSLASWDAQYGPRYAAIDPGYTGSIAQIQAAPQSASLTTVQPIPDQQASPAGIAVVQPRPIQSIDPDAASQVATLQPAPVSDASIYVAQADPAPAREFLSATASTPADSALAASTQPVVVTEFPVAPVSSEHATFTTSEAPVAVSEVLADQSIAAAPQASAPGPEESTVQMVSQPVVQPIPEDETG